ncbi:MAG: hypothetical protein H0V27_12235 [Pyrinomonadaceae bacterium]|nr:hypothetical protein [Pyrinomonadaceae bacterium]
MNTMKHSFYAAMVMMMLAAFGVTTQAQRQPSRVSDQQVQNVLRRLETDTDRYRESLDEGLDRSRYDGSRTEDDIVSFVRNFEEATDRLKDRFNNRRSVAGDVEEVLERAAVIDDFMRRNRLTARAERDWRIVRQDLNQLARAYGVAPNFRRNNPLPNNGIGTGSGIGSGGYGTDARLTGTFRRDARRSDDPRVVATNAVRSLPYRERQQVYDAVVARLDSPDVIAIERRGRSVTIVSSRGAQTTFEADGTERTEQLPNGRTARVSARLNGDQLIVRSSGFRENDFDVTFEPFDNGRAIRVTRSIYSERLTPPVTVRSIYNRTADVAQYDVYNNTGSGVGSGTGTGTTTSNGYVVPNNTLLTAVLDTDLSTRNVQENQRFSMRVRDNGQYDGAQIEGYVSNVSRSGRVSGRSGLTLNFDRITLRDGRSYRFAGTVDSVRLTNGETVRVDNEGTVQDSNQTNRTITRGATGAAIGAIIGAIAGGGKGAAIGAAIGAGAGAGSVYVQGRDDLDLTSGSEVTVRASAPR